MPGEIFLPLTHLPSTLSCLTSCCIVTPPTSPLCFFVQVTEIVSDWPLRVLAYPVAASFSLAGVALKWDGVRAVVVVELPQAPEVDL